MGLLDIFKNKPAASKKATSKKSPVKTEEKKEAAVKKEAPVSTLKAKSESTPTTVTSPKAVKAKKDDTKEAYRVLVKPLVTEKASAFSVLNKYCFAVNKNTNKIEVKKAIKSLYGFDPINVNIVIMRGKWVRQGRVRGKKSNWKKAIVTLKKGDKIEIYEGV
jgi:large subunit ribosomal protein L23